MNTGTTSVCDEPSDLRQKNNLLCENISICLALYFLMSCKTALLSSTSPFLSYLYKYWTKTCKVAGMERSQVVQSSNRFSIIQIPPCHLFLKTMPLLHKTKLLLTEPQKLHPFTTTDPEFFKCELNDCLQAPEYRVKQI